MTSDFEVPDGNKDLNDTEEEQTATSNNQTSPATCGSNSRCACASSKTELTMTLNKLKKTGSGVQRNGPECSCAATRQKKALTTHTSPSKLIDIFSLPVATLCTPLKLPIISDRSCGNSPDKHIQRRTEELSFEDGVLQTPPPEYSSRFTLFDIPPDYEAVTGIPLARDLDLSKQKDSDNGTSGNSSQSTIPSIGRTIIVVIVIIVMIITLTLIATGIITKD